jgi:hypothetical protein
MKTHFRSDANAHLQCFASELNFVALDVFNEENLELCEVVQGEVADCITQNTFLNEELGDTLGGDGGGWR